MGSNLVEVDSILFDTSSAWIALETIDCTDCYITYDYSENPDTYNALPDTDMTLTTSKGVEVDGSVAIDWVCLSSDTDTCVTDFPWMNVASLGLGDDLNGVLGMCADPSSITDSSGPNYIEYLYNQEIIDIQLFSVALSADSDTSFVDIGFYDLDAFTSDLVWIDVINHETYGQFWWANQIQGLRFRGSSTVELSTSTTFSVVDTSNNCISLPDDLYTFVIDYLIAQLNYSETDDAYGLIFYCDEVNLLPSVDFLFGGYWVEVSPDDIVLNYGSNVCSFCIIKSTIEQITLGASFLLGYYAVHDMDNLQMGFAPLASADNQKISLEAGGVPDTYYGDYKFGYEMNTYAFMALSIGSGLSLFFITNYLLYKMVILKDAENSGDQTEEVLSED